MPSLQSVGRTQTRQKPPFTAEEAEQPSRLQQPRYPPLEKLGAGRWIAELGVEVVQHQPELPRVDGEGGPDGLLSIRSAVHAASIGERPAWPLESSDLWAPDGRLSRTP